MRWLKSNIEKISNLKAEGSPESLTYAALECRLAIERICYDRLRIAHDYISQDDIRKWQPKDVVNTLIQEVDSKIAASYTFSIGKEPIKKEGDLTREDYETMEFVPVGSQVGFDPKKMGKLWNAISSFLHVKVPKVKSDRVTEYGDPAALVKKIDEVLAELEHLSQGTLIGSGFGETVSFTCDCGLKIMRRVAFLGEGQIVNCLSPECLESYTCIFNEEDIDFIRNTMRFNCYSCEAEITFPKNKAVKLQKETAEPIPCGRCGETNYIMWQLKQVVKNSE
ncbi:hypothetical protein GFK91_31490 (plasmid) [Roseibium aggregatum]|uniref:hypothetical protein n=1 Tax=Roseibium aggregatum TaxID=187304 RepID=UPI001E49A1AB|nr:hypothetical protein [Roseibium aggregatum]UES60238.1 hypothetical protein GFK91_31490 [Roseibium aggregatum]